MHAASAIGPVFCRCILFLHCNIYLNAGLTIRALQMRFVLALLNLFACCFRHRGFADAFSSCIVELT